VHLAIGTSDIYNKGLDAEASSLVHIKCNTA